MNWRFPEDPDVEGREGKLVSVAPYSDIRSFYSHRSQFNIRPPLTSL